MVDIVLEEHAIFKWQKLKEKCEDKKLPFDLTVSQVKKFLTRKTCFYTGSHFGDKPQDKLTFDRVYPERGYVNSNIVVCKQSVNLLKANLTSEEIFNMCKQLRSLETK